MAFSVIMWLIFTLNVSVLMLVALVFLFNLIKLCLIFKQYFWKRNHHNIKSVGFFHPYCNAGGGGERVLWNAIRVVQNRFGNVHCIVYTGDNVPGNVILEKVEKSFKIKLPEMVEFIHLKTRTLIEAKNYPYFTLLLQSLGSCVLGLEAALRHKPDIYIDTMGCAFTYPIFKKLCGCATAAYVHYPTISTDMLSSVSNQNVTVNNREFISRSKILTFLKTIYYKIFAKLYNLVGRQADVIMVNSSWTQNHILELWNKPDSTFVVYPPCDVSYFQTLPLKPNINRENMRIISIAQFRPEKNHELQLDAFKNFLDNHPSVCQHATLILIGSCRHEDDYARVERLKSLCSEKGIEEKVEFRLNLTFDEMIQEMKDADVALHTMWNEHFGIGVVECMSAGLITIAHDSGGPKLDIITPGRTGFLASDISSYADALHHVWKMDSDQLLEMKINARESVLRFSFEKFRNSSLPCFDKLYMAV